jgi:hypothetical protein
MPYAVHPLCHRLFNYKVSECETDSYGRDCGSGAVGFLNAWGVVT